MPFSQVFIKEIEKLLGKETDDFFTSLAVSFLTSVRFNKGKRMNLHQLPLSGNVPWCDSGFYLEERPRFTLDPLLHAGCYYVQEASSMFLAEIVQQLFGEEHNPINALDLCAAPGGKTTLLADYLPQNSCLVANEVIRSRAHILVENISKWGNPNLIVCNNDPKDFGKLASVFDIIFVDAPCSGEGMFRKNPEAYQEWSPANVQLCAERQRRILSHAWNSLKPNGYLVYSTCTFNTKENEENVQWMLEEWAAESVAIRFDKSWGIRPSKSLPYFESTSLNAYHFFPHQVNGEGFFVAVLQKKEDRVIPSKYSSKNKRENLKKNVLAEAYKLMKRADEFFYLQENAIISALPHQHIEMYNLLSKYLNIVQAGVLIAQLKGKDILPHHNLALSTVSKLDAFMSVNVDLQTAQRFLRRETIELDGLQKGIYLLRYQSQALGFIKHLGMRCNNLYPNEWRIRMQL
ncbi:MAG: methyltransferase RsmF C-terminal domain-like protein [Bacteroidales bacterium]